MTAFALAALAIAVEGCGEANKPATQQNAQAAGTTSSTSMPPATGSIGSQNAGAGEGRTRSDGTRQSGAHAAQPAQNSGTVQQSVHPHRRAHLVLPGPNSHRAPHLSAAERANVSVADITLSSSGITQPGSGTQSVLARRYTCQGADTPPPLRWKGIPPGTSELALFVLNTQPVHEKLFFDWAVAGLPGDLKELDGARLPAGAIVGRNSLGQNDYSLCPSNGRSETYLFVLYALPQRLSARTGFEPANMRTRAIGLAHHSGILFGSYG